MDAMNYSTAGLIGAVAGVLWAFVPYALVAKAHKQQLAGATPDDRPGIENSWWLVRMALLSNFVVSGGVGYYVAQMFDV